MPKVIYEMGGVSAIVREFARIWQALPKVVFSRSLDSVAEPAAEAARLNLIDEYRLFGTQ